MDNGRYAFLAESDDGRQALIYDKRERRPYLLTCDFGRFYTQCAPTLAGDEVICIALDRPEGGRVNLRIDDVKKSHVTMVPVFGR